VKAKAIRIHISSLLWKIRDIFLLDISDPFQKNTDSGPAEDLYLAAETGWYKSVMVILKTITVFFYNTKNITVYKIIIKPPPLLSVQGRFRF